MAMSPCPPQLIWQQEVVMCTRFGISARRNSSISSSIIDLTTPEASVPGMSQCSQPWVWEMKATEFLRPPDHEAVGLQRLDQRLDLGLVVDHVLDVAADGEAHVAVRVPIADLAELAQGEDVEDALGAGAHRPDLVAALGDVAEHSDPGDGCGTSTARSSGASSGACTGTRPGIPTRSAFDASSPWPQVLVRISAVMFFRSVFADRDLITM